MLWLISAYSPSKSVFIQNTVMTPTQSAATEPKKRKPGLDVGHLENLFDVEVLELQPETLFQRHVIYEEKDQVAKWICGLYGLE